MDKSTGSQKFHKSFVAFLTTAVVAGVLVTIFTSIAASTSGGVKSLCQVVSTLIFLWGLYRLIYLFTIRWLVDQQGVTISRGILPWRRSSFFVPYDNIFEAFSQHGFFGYFLQYGTATLRRTEGSTTALSDTRMHRSKKLTGLINAALQQLHAQARVQPQPAVPQPAVPVSGTGTSDIEKLGQLSLMRANGDITEAEYAVLKARIIGS
jgi:hypothetical protein